MTEPRRPPVILDEAIPPSPGRGAPSGAKIREGFALPATPWDLASRSWLCRGTVAGEADAAAAVQALSRGVGLVLRLEVRGDLRLRLLEDLHRLGDVRPAGAASAAELGSEAHLLLRSLADGTTVAQAARALHLSERSAHRRLAEARTTIGVGTNVEAVAWWRMQGSATEGPR